MLVFRDGTSSVERKKQQVRNLLSLAAQCSDKEAELCLMRRAQETLKEILE